MKLQITAIALACFATAGHAELFTYTGDTTGGPTFNRPLADLTGISSVGTSVPYSEFLFTASVDGTYTFLSTGQFDNFLLLYEGSFNPASPLTNAIIGNDDLLTATTSGFAGDLTAGITYVLVTTGFSNTDFGAFSNTIGGPGVVAAIPEPGTYAMLLAGLGVVGACARRRRQAA